jgi:hypothetical protein
MSHARWSAEFAVIEEKSVKHGLIIAVGVFLLTASALVSSEDSITGEIVPGVRASFKHRIDVVSETWPSALMETAGGRACLDLESKGGFRLHARVRECPGEYLICVIYVGDGTKLVLGRDTRFVLLYGNRRVESDEILLTDGPEERRVYSSKEDPIVLTDHSKTYAKARSGGFLAAVRFSGGSLPTKGSWVPDSFVLRGGDVHEGVPN